MKFGIRECVDVYLKAKSTFKLGARTMRAGEPVLIFDTVKVGTLDVSATTNYATGGRGNPRILSYEGDKVTTFNFTEALLSAEALAILTGADLIPARNAHLPGAPTDANAVISHYNERFSVTTPNRVDTDKNNVYDGMPIGGIMNVWLSNKPYIGRNSSVYVMLLDTAGEMSGAPLEVNIANTGTQYTAEMITAAMATGDTSFMGVPIAQRDNPTTAEVAAVNNVVNGQSYIAQFSRVDNKFVAFDKGGAPMSLVDYPDPAAVDGSTIPVNKQQNDQSAVFDDLVGYYVDIASATASWSYDDIANYTRTITGTGAAGWDVATNGLYGYLIGQPKAFKEGSSFVYKANVPSVLSSDIVLLDYYVEHRHDATQIDITPDKFGGYFYIEGATLVRRASDGADLAATLTIPRFKVTTAISLAFQGTGDPSTFDFAGDAYPDYLKFDQTKRVLASIQIIGADDNYDAPTGGGEAVADPTSYRRFRYDQNSEGEYLWKDPSITPHSNLDYSDPQDYVSSHGGPATKTPGIGQIDNAPSDGGYYGAPGANPTAVYPIAPPDPEP